MRLLRLMMGAITAAFAALLPFGAFASATADTALDVDAASDEMARVSLSERMHLVLPEKATRVSPAPTVSPR